MKANTATNNKYKNKTRSRVAKNTQTQQQQQQQLLELYIKRNHEIARNKQTDK